MKFLLVYVLIVSVVTVISSGVIEKRKEKRGFATAPVLSSHGYSSGLDNTYGLQLNLGGRVGLAAGPTIAAAAGPVIAASPVTVTTVTRKVPVPAPQPVHVPYFVDVPRPVPVAVPQPVQVTLLRPVSVNVPRPAIPATVLQPIPIAQPVAVRVPHPVSLTLHQPVAGTVPQPSLTFEGLRIGGFGLRKGFGLPDSNSHVSTSLGSDLHGYSYAPSYFPSYSH